MKKRYYQVMAVAMVGFGSLLAVPNIGMPNVIAYASEATGSITIKANGEQKLLGKEFLAYQLFDLTYVSSGIEDQNRDNNFAYALKDEYVSFFKEELKLTVLDNQSVDEVAYEYINSLDNRERNLLTKQLYDYAMEQEITGVKGSCNLEGTRYTIEGLQDGYYLLFETKTEEGGVQSRGMLSTVVVEINDDEKNTGAKHVVITQKAMVPSLDKEIYHDDLGSFGKVGDNAIGDLIDYRIITTVPDTTGFETYTYTIHDDMEKGLTFIKDSLQLYCDEERSQEIKTGYQLVTDSSSLLDDCTFEVRVSRETLDELYNAGVTCIYTYYQCELNEQAEIADEHNDNSARLEYSNRPYQDSTDTTKKVTVYDYTFAMDLVKQNEAGDALSMAEFELRYMDQPLELLCTEENVYYLKGALKANQLSASYKETNKIVTAADGRIHVIGLNDATTYDLVETKAPKGYKRCKDIAIVLTANYDKVTKLLKDLSVSPKELVIRSYLINGSVIDEGQPELPVTGGRVTLGLYGIGLLLGLTGVSFLGLGFRRKKGQRSR